jgi:hypothetical protein
MAELSCPVAASGRHRMHLWTWGDAVDRADAVDHRKVAGRNAGSDRQVTMINSR